MLGTAVLACFLLAATVNADPEVHRIWPTVGSTAGGTRITLYGIDFARDGFSFGAGNEDKGNTVALVAEDQESHVCTIHKDGNTEEMITCDTPNGLTHNKVYYVKATVDGVEVPADKTCVADRARCGFKAHNWYTPSVTGFNSKTFSLADDASRMLTVTGRIVTDLYGSDKSSASNGVTQSFKRVYNGGGTCELRDDSGVEYGLSLDSSDSYYGSFTCKLTGTFVGCSRFSFIIDNPYGRSKVTEEQVTATDKVCHLQSYTEVSSISPNEGSTEGGTLVTVDGHYFEDGTLNAPSSYSNMTFLVAGVPCQVVNVIKNSYATVRTPPQSQLPDMGASWPGNRGTYVEYWSSGTYTNDELRDTTTPETGKVFLDETYFFNHTLLSTANTRMSYFFKAPHDGQYAFYLLATNGGELYINGTSWAQSSGGWSTKGRVTFTKNTYSKVVVVAMSGTNTEASVGVKFRFYNTTLLNSRALSVRQEVWDVRLRSPILNEEFSIVPSGFTSQTPTSEKQKVCPTGGLKAKLCLYGVCTMNAITFSETTSDIVTEMNNLPFLSAGESFSAAINPTDSTCYDITFNSNRGNIPPITTNTAGVTVTSTELVAGVPNNTAFSLMYGNVPSRLELYDETDKAAFATKLDGMLEDVFSTGCPVMFTAGEGFERGTTTFGDKAETDIIPFCGRYSYKNPAEVWPLPETTASKPSLALKSWMCLAINGLDNNNIYISYETPSYRERNNRPFTFTSITVPESEGGWSYACVNLLLLVKSENLNESGDNYKLVRVYFRNNVDFYVDEVVFGLSPVLKITAQTDLTGVRLLPGSPNPSLHVLVKDVGVVYNQAEERYDATLAVHECGSSLDLLTLANSDLTTGSKTFPSNTVTSTLTGGSAALLVTSITKATPALAGTYSVVIAGETTGAIGAQDTDAEIKNKIESSTNIGSVKVTSSAASTCATKDISIELSALAGDQPLGSLSGVALTAPSGATGELVAKTDGHLEVSYIIGDYTRTVHDKPQIEVTVNNIPCKCKTGVDCSFEFKSSATPTVTSLSQASGASGLALTVSGTLLSADATVDIGGVACIVTSGSSSNVECTVGDGPIGQYDVIVMVPGYGRAAGSARFEYTSDLSGISPTEGAIAGGNTVTLTGHGFSDVSQVFFGAAECTKKGVPTANQIVCIVPAYTDLTANADQAVTVKVTKGTEDMPTTQTYTHRPSLSPVITSLSLADPLPVSGGVAISIAGSNFGSSPTLSIGGVPCVITSSSDTSVIATTPVLAPGDNQVVALNNGNGIALFNNVVPSRSVRLVVNNMFPIKGSYLGGTSVTLTGSGFGTVKEDVEAYIGETPCVVDTVMDTQIVCDIQSTAKWHYINNLGTTGMMEYYSFNVTALRIPVGDCVRFTWTSPSFLDIKHGIYQTDNVTTSAKTPDGIDSGAPSKNGQYEYCFSTEGIYYLSSGLVDANALRIYYMTTTVTSRPSSSGPLSLRVNGQEAVYDDDGTADPSSSGCAKLNSDIADCTPDTVTHQDPSHFNFEFANCRTPSVDTFEFESLSPGMRSAKGSTVLTVTGKGFSDSNACTNKAKIGNCDCTVTPVSSTQFTCIVDSSCAYPIAQYLKLSLSVGGYGSAQMNIASWKSKSVAFMMEITGITPKSVSTEGGTLVSVTGSGLSAATLVEIDDVAVSFTEDSGALTVTTEVSSKAAANLTVYSSTFKAECSISGGNCQLAFTSTQTPTVSAVSPSLVSGATTLAFTGTKFGTDRDAVKVTIAGEDCPIQSLDSETTLSCRVNALPAGVHTPVLNVAGLGNARTTQTVTGEATLTAVSPTTGSTNGGTAISFSGHGFNGETTVEGDGGIACKDAAVTLTQVTCTTLLHAAGTVDLTVTSGGTTYPSVSFTFDSSSTPNVADVTASIASGDTMSVTGSGFGTDASAVHVFMENYECAVTSATDSLIECTVGAQDSGNYGVAVLVDGKGLSNNGSTTYQIRATSINPTSGAKVGNQLLSVVGSGFTEQVVATVCGNPCTFDSVTSSEYVCVTPAGNVGSCAVQVQDGAGAAVLTVGNYEYIEAAVPTITSITPTNGGTGGGTRVTMAGMGLSGSVISVSIDGAACTVDTGESDDTVIVCTTGAHVGTISAPVLTIVDGSRAVGAVQFQYVDRWSSHATWGGMPPPEAGDLVSIPPGQTILLDVDTPILGMILIEGTLLFDDSVSKLIANSKIILIANGGAIRAGTPENPYPSQLDIVLHGNAKDYNLPIYGTKNIAVRNGTLDLHGMPLTTWVKLTSTAAAGSTQLRINIPAQEWKVGDSIVIATTGGQNSQHETETRTISAISEDKMTITVSEPLEYEHFSNTAYSCTLNSGDELTRDLSAEVGHLTRNIRVMGSNNVQWNDDIEACEDGHDTGEFATQTCFQGRHGEEVGSDQFGAHIIVHPSVKDSNSAIVRLSFIEVTVAGQAFQLGRYPVHFHMGGDMSKSYVKGCAIHQTFNRAITIHGSSNVLIENNVVYNVMGGAVFLEDGIEEANILQYNLLVFVRASSSLLNDDITPAGFWATNPNNDFLHNAVAGGTHFAWWYRMLEHPSGPSYTTSVCPRKVPLGRFYNNTAHSCGWFGLWTFEDYFPVVGGGCSGTTPTTVVFEKFTTWNNDKGAEYVNYANLQLLNYVSVNEKKAGFEGKQDMSHGCLSPTIKDSCIDGTLNAGNTPTLQAVKVPYGTCFQMENVVIKDVPLALGFTEIQGTCTKHCGGFESMYSQMDMSNVDNLVEFRWVHEGIMTDTDGSLCGVSEQGCKLIPEPGTHIPASLNCPTACARSTTGQPARFVVGSVKFIRLGFKDVFPSSLNAKNVTATNNHGSTYGIFDDKRLTEKPGWMLNLMEGYTYKLEFENAPEMVNVSFNGALYGLKEGHCIIFGLRVSDVPDRVYTIDDTFKNMSTSPFDCTTDGLETGDWYLADNFAYFAIKVPVGTGRRKRSGPSIPKGEHDMSLAVKVEKCFYENCIPPHNPETDPPLEDRPADHVFWNSADIWMQNGDGEFVTRTNDTPGTAGLPVAGSNVVISSDIAGAWWVVIKQYNPPDLGNVVVYGGLEIDYLAGYTYTFRAKNIIIFGGRFVVGWPNNPVLGIANVVLLGDQSSPWYSGVDGYTVSNKAIGVFGGFDAHGASTGSSWGRLASTASAGTNTLSLEPGTDMSGWGANDELVITTTTQRAAETEYHTIATVDASARTVTLTNNLAYTHYAITEAVGSENIVFAAAVGHLTRRVKIMGEDVEQWGARILVSTGQMGSEAKTGFIRASYMEGKFLGQEGFTDPSDPRFALALVSSSWSTTRPSYVTQCSFHHLHNSAIGLLSGADNITMSDNVVAGPVGNGVVVDSNNVSVVSNLVTNQAWTGSVYGRNEAENIRFEANFLAIGATSLTFKNNYAAGAERVGFRVPGEKCGVETSKYGNNFAVGNLMGVNTFADDDLTVEAGQTCTLWSGFRTWNNYDYGIYYNNLNEFEGNDLVMAGENTAMYVFIVGPSALDHQCSDKQAKITDSTVIGTLTGHDCSSYVQPSGTYISTSDHCRSQRSGLGGRLGLVVPVFSQAPNNSPQKPCGNIMSYNALCGQTTMSGITFKNFGPHSTCGASFAVAFSPSNDDANHAVYMSGTTVYNVNQDYAVLIPKPRVSMINSADCVDMDCDGLKQALLVDTDGSIFGTVTSVISQSEAEWDGDPRRGLGDYRIPKAMLTSAVGDRIEVSEIADGKGIYRSGCTLVQVDNTASWRCPNSNYELLVIESMDDDTETRRLSPVAVLNGRYLDLLNGPQDHGWCSGYTCRLRLSTFTSVIAPGHPTQIYLSSTEPEQMRFFMIRASAESCVVVAFFFTNPNRIDILDGEKTYILPTNGLMTNGKFSYNRAGTPESYIPTCANDHGTNYIDKDNRLVYFVLKGSNMLHLKRAKVLVLAMSLPMTEDEFFGSNLIENLALLLNIPLTKIRVTKVVAETSSGSRRRRATDSISVTFELGDSPEEDPTSSVDVTPLAETVVNECQAGTLGTSLGTADLACSNITLDETTYTLAVPSELRFEEAIVPQHENVPFTTQPKIRAYDASGVVVPTLGVESALWEVTATLRSGTGHASAVLSGTTTITASSGWLNFTDLAISHAGSGYIIDFEITAPSSAAAMNLTLPSATFTLAGVPMVAGLNSLTTGYITQSSTFSMTLDLRDNTTNQAIPDITWRGHTFSTTCGLVFSPETGNLTGTLTKSFDTSTGTAVFNDLIFSGSGLVILACQVESTPAEYSFTHYQEIMVYTAAQASVTTEDTSVITLRFNEDFYTTLPNEAAEKQFLMAALQKLTSPDTRVLNARLEQGSILVIYTVEGSVVSVTEMKTDLCANVSAGLTVTVGSVTLTMDTYMRVDGVDYYATCGTTADDDDDDGLHGAFIALIVVLCVVVLALIALLLLWKFKVLPKTKTHGGMRVVVQGFNENLYQDAQHERFNVQRLTGETNGEAAGNRYPGGFYYIDNGRTVFLGGPNQRVEDIFYKQKNTGVLRQSSDMAPPVTTLYDDLEGNNVTTRKSPLPQDALYKEWTMTRPDN